MARRFCAICRAIGPNLWGLSKTVHYSWAAGPAGTNFNRMPWSDAQSASGKGARVRYNTRVREIHVASDRGVEIVTENETIKANVLVNASGAWANVIAEMAGARQLPLRPCRRHLFVSPPTQWVDPNWP